MVIKNLQIFAVYFVYSLIVLVFSLAQSTHGISPEIPPEEPFDF